MFIVTHHNQKCLPAQCSCLDFTCAAVYIYICYWDSTVGIVTKSICWATKELCFDQCWEREIFVFSKMLRLVLEPTQPALHWVRGLFLLGVVWLRHETDHSCLSSSRIKTLQSFISIPPYTFCHVWEPCQFVFYDVSSCDDAAVNGSAINLYLVCMQCEMCKTTPLEVYFMYLGNTGVHCIFNTLRTGSFKLFKRPLPGFLTILTL